MICSALIFGVTLKPQLHGTERHWQGGCSALSWVVWKSRRCTPCCPGNRGCSTNDGPQGQPRCATTWNEMKNGRGFFHSLRYLSRSQQFFTWHKCKVCYYFSLLLRCWDGAFHCCVCFTCLVSLWCLFIIHNGLDYFFGNYLFASLARAGLPHLLLSSRRELLQLLFFCS